MSHWEQVMTPSLNLSPARGPSTWERMERESQRDKFGMTLIGVGLSLVTAGLLLRPWGRRRSLAGVRRRKAADDGVDRASADSFPASDPPSIPAPDSTS
jgi:hypothetical protein